LILHGTNLGLEPVLCGVFLNLDFFRTLLKPGYVWELEQGKFYTAKSVPTEWRPGATEARITDLDFLEID
jgi:hypothetical protein